MTDGLEIRCSIQLSYEGKWSRLLDDSNAAMCAEKVLQLIATGLYLGHVVRLRSSGS